MKIEIMNSVLIRIPDSVNLKNFDFSVYIASKMYEDGMVTAGQAAEIVGISKRTFIEIMGRYGVSVFSKSFSDLSNDVANA